MYPYRHRHICTYTHRHTQIYTYTCAHIHTYRYTNIRLYICTPIHMYTAPGIASQVSVAPSPISSSSLTNSIETTSHTYCRKSSCCCGLQALPPDIWHTELLDICRRSKPSFEITVKVLTNMMLSPILGTRCHNCKIRCSILQQACGGTADTY